MKQTATRRQRVERATSLRSEGLTLRQIGDEMGIDLKRASELIRDPDGTKEWQRKHRGRCEDCGRPMTNPRPGHPGRRCSSCQHKAERKARVWTRETIVEAIHHWMSLYDEPPSASAWTVTVARPLDRSRYLAGHYPPCSQVQRRFGRFGDALVAAGVTPKHPGACKPRNSVTAEENDRLRTMREEGASFPMIAKALGIKAPAAYMRWRKLQPTGGVRVTPSLSAETVIERQIERCEAKAKQAEADAKEAKDTADRLRQALAALRA